MAVHMARAIVNRVFLFKSLTSELPSIARLALEYLVVYPFVDNVIAETYNHIGLLGAACFFSMSPAPAESASTRHAHHGGYLHGQVILAIDQLVAPDTAGAITALPGSGR
jgi:hypothetical protein